MEMVGVLDRSHKIIKKYWCLSDILKGINNINMAWEVVAEKCLKGVWCICPPKIYAQLHMI